MLGLPWNLFDFQRCLRVPLAGIQDNASGATYNPTTNTLWVITNVPKKLLEYTVRGELVRELPWSGFRDPEGKRIFELNTMAFAD